MATDSSRSTPVDQPCNAADQAEDAGPSEPNGRGTKVTDYWPDEWTAKDISGMPDDQEFKLKDGTVVTGAEIKKNS